MSTEFTVNPARQDPYKNFKFHIRWDGKVIAGISRISGLKKSTIPVIHRDGADPNIIRLSPGVWTYEPITLERGITHDPEFENWANLVNQFGGEPEISLKNFRKDITIDLLNEQGTIVKSFRVYRCWISEYIALPELDAGGKDTAIERIVLQNEGWERDTAVTEPEET